MDPPAATELSATGVALNVLKAKKLKKSSDDALNISKLREETWIKIFSYLTQKELGRMLRVCKEWNMLARTSVFWKKVNIEFEKITLFSGSQNNAVKSLLDFLPSRVTHIQLSFKSYGWTRPLNFEELSVKLEKFPHLEMLFLKKAKFSDTLPSVIDLCAQYRPNLKMLVFHHSTFGERHARKIYSGTYNFEVLDFNWCHLGLYNKIPFLRMHHLKRLCLADQYADNEFLTGDTSFLDTLHLPDNEIIITLVFDDSYVIYTPSFMKWLDVLDLGNTRCFDAFKTAKSYGLNLKELYLCYNTNLEDPDLDFQNFPRLKTICLNNCLHVTCEGIIKLIQSCQSLENVYVKEDVAESYKIHPFVVDNRCKLEIVKVINCKDHRKIDY